MRVSLCWITAAVLVATGVTGAFARKAKDIDEPEPQTLTPIDQEVRAKINLNLLGKAFAKYTASHEGHWPANLEALAPYHDRPEALQEHEYLYLRPMRGTYGDSENSMPIVYEKRGERLLILLSAGQVAEAKVDIRPDLKPSSILEFRIVPPQVGGDSADEYQQILKTGEYQRFLKSGKTGQWWVGKSDWTGSIPACIWLPVRGNIPFLGGMVVGEHQGRTFLLVSNELDKVMLAPSSGGPAWGLTHVCSHGDDRNRPAIAFLLDKEGSQLLDDLTNRNQGQLLAVVIDGEIVSVQPIRSVMREEVIITGAFDKHEVQRLAQALQTGMPPTPPPPVRVQIGGTGGQ